jgi:HK97 gp10 family phage protein
MELRGERELIRQLKHLAEKGVKRASRKAVNAAGTPILKAIRSRCPAEEGEMKKCLAKKVITRDKRFDVIVGCDTKKLRTIPRPSNVDYLVEFGHTAPDGTVTPPHPFVRPGAAESESAALSAYTAKLATEIENEAEKEG